MKSLPVYSVDSKCRKGIEWRIKICSSNVTLPNPTRPMDPTRVQLCDSGLM